MLLSNLELWKLIIFVIIAPENSKRQMFLLPHATMKHVNKTISGDRFPMSWGCTRDIIKYLTLKQWRHSAGRGEKVRTCDSWFHTQTLPLYRLANIHGSVGCKSTLFTLSDRAVSLRLMSSLKGYKNRELNEFMKNTDITHLFFESNNQVHHNENNYSLSQEHCIFQNVELITLLTKLITRQRLFVRIYKGKSATIFFSKGSSQIDVNLDVR